MLRNNTQFIQGSKNSPFYAHLAITIKRLTAPKTDYLLSVTAVKALLGFTL